MKKELIFLQKLFKSLNLILRANMLSLLGMLILVVSVNQSGMGIVLAGQ